MYDNVHMYHSNRQLKRVGHGREREVVDGRRGIQSRNGESIDLLGQHVTNFSTKSCMVAYEW